MCGTARLAVHEVCVVEIQADLVADTAVPRCASHISTQVTSLKQGVYEYTTGNAVSLVVDENFA